MLRIRRMALTVGAGAILFTAGIVGGLPALAGSAAHAPTLPGLNIGTPSMTSQHTWVAYYDGHKDKYLNTDVSDKSQAKSLGINFAPVLAHSLNASSPMYFVKGKAAVGQIAVFGSEPGESDYSPLWREILVTWKAGATPKLLVRDDQVNALVKSGKLSEQITKIVLNAPVTSVGH